MNMNTIIYLHLITSESDISMLLLADVDETSSDHRDASRLLVMDWAEGCCRANG